MKIYGNVILPQKIGVLYGTDKPADCCLWVNPGEASGTIDPDAANALIAYIDSENNIQRIYPVTTIKGVYGLTEELNGIRSGCIDTAKNMIHAITATLAADGWKNNQISVTVPGVTADNIVIVSYAEGSFEAYCNSSVRCIGQASGTLTFACESVPEIDIRVNVILLNEVSK